MSEQGRHRLLSRMGSALLGLESLSDGKTASLDPNKVHGGEGAGLSLMRDKSPLEFHTSELEALCARMEDRIAQERRFVAPPATKAQEDYWFFEEWEGKDYHVVADHLGWDPDEVWRKRERRGLNPKDGRQLAA